MLNDKLACKLIFRAISVHTTSIDEWKGALERLGLTIEDAAASRGFNEEITCNFLVKDPVELAEVLLRLNAEVQFRLLNSQVEGNIRRIVF